MRDEPRRRRITAPAVTLAALAAAAVVASAPAGVPLVDRNGVPYKWDLDTQQPNVVSGEVTFYADAASLRDTVNGSKSASAAITDAVQAWAVGTTRIRFRPDLSRSAVGRNGSDRVNWIGWSSNELGPLTFAATFPTRNGSTVTDMDVVMNDASFSWDTWSFGVAGDADIQSLVTHEWGHAIGCDHVPLRLSTMYYAANLGQISLRSIEPDDRALVGQIYPNDAFAATTGTLHGAVAVDGVKDDRAVSVVAVSVATAEPAASALTAPNGTFSIVGLPRGAYRVVATPTNPLGSAMNEWWRSGSTSFLPAVAGSPQANPGPATTFLVGEAESVAAGTFHVAQSAAPLEPNDTKEQATTIRVGEAVAARFENTTDFDWYGFDATAGERLTFSVLAWELGSDADPTLRLADAGGNTVQQSFDIRNNAFASQLSGEDRDARIQGWTVPTTGRWFLRVGQDVAVRTSQNFYVLFVSVASDAPSPALTTAAADPDRIDAGGLATTLLVVMPRREDGTPVGAGASVALAHSGAGDIGPVSDAGDGTYTATVTSAPSTGSDIVSVVVTTGLGVATTPDAETITYVGPALVAQSSLTITPRRLAPDGSAHAVVRFVPRDVNHEVVGAGRAVSVALVPSAPPPGGAPLDATLTATDDVGDGTYEATVTAGTARGAATVTAAVPTPVPGLPMTLSARVAFGFALTDVLPDAVADVVGFRAVPGLPARVTAPLAQADAQLAAARAAADAAAASALDAASTAAAAKSERTALVKTRAALTSIDTALTRAKGALTDPGARRDLGLALRERAVAAAARAVIRNARDQRKLDRATALIAKGDTQSAGPTPTAAATSWLKAYLAVFGLL